MNIADDIEAVVDLIRERGIFIISAPVDGMTYTVEAPNETLKDYQFIEFEGLGNIQIKEVTEDGFKFDSDIAPPNSGAFKSLAPYFLYGHRLEIANRLMEKDTDDKFKYQKYPLIALKLPFTQGKQRDRLINLSLNVAIMDFTDLNYNSEDRYLNVIEPILEPIYNKFIVALVNSYLFNVIGTPEHNRIDRLFWGIENKEGNIKSIFTDPLDAIEITDLKLKKIYNNC